MSGIADTKDTFTPGDVIRVIGVPSGLEMMPDESRNLFASIVGRELRVDEVAEWGDLVLNLREDGTQSPNWNEHTLWLPPTLAELVTPAEPPR